MDLLAIFHSFVAELGRIWMDSPTFFVASIAAAVAWFSYRHTRKQNICKNTLDFQTHWNDSERVDEAWNTFSEMAIKSGGRLTVIDAAATANFHTKEAKDLRELLNRMECAAAAISRGLYDEAMLRKNYSGPWLRMWRVVYDDFVCKRRTIADNPRIYEQLEEMFVRWQKLRDKEDEKLRKNGKKSKFSTGGKDLPGA